MVASDSVFDTATEAVEALIAGFPTAGVHEVCVSGVDEAGNSSNQDCILLAVFDPSAGFVTGGGWIDSPPGAYTPENPNDPDILGKANFGFVSKYKKGAQIPEGQTEFRFQAANLNFHSDRYDWLVLAGKRAQFKGDGSINGVEGFGFLLTAIDDDTDRFRIKIWNVALDEVVYDNKAGSSDTSEDATVLGGGNIVIHKK